MQRFVFFVVLMALLVAPLAAQAPAGWQVRVDRSQNFEDPDDVPELMVMTMGNGFHVKGGPAGVFWNPTNRATGDFTAKASFTLLEPSSHTNYYGLTFGGADLASDAQKYVYFLVAQNGNFLIKWRNGDEVGDIVASTPNAAIRTPGADGRSTNMLEVRVAGNTISYVVNGTVVHTTPKSGATAVTDGVVGVRVNHVLSVQVDDFEVG
ncbi:MAG: hypothetical protein O2930_13190 [Acidobacteria bacterium]|nr:hypothetical protein [Acidobacteriota bacterium]